MRAIRSLPVANRSEIAIRHGRVQAYCSAAGFGLRLDGGTAYTGAVITPYYDSLLVKMTAWAPSVHKAIRRMDRGLRQFRIGGWPPIRSSSRT
jgi:pyruvate carboxylase